MCDEEGGALYWCDWSKDNAYRQTNDRENKYFIPKIEVFVLVVEPKFDFEKL